MIRWQPAYVGIGSNLDDPQAQVQRALAALRALPQSQLILQSSLWRTAPVGPPQPDYCNAVAAILTTLPALVLLHALQRTEKELGRAPSTVRWGPRRIDLDLLVYGQETLQLDELQLPHAQIAHRAFVLAPLCEIAPQLHIPGLGVVERLASQVDSHGVTRIQSPASAHAH